jgi:hypothetical protein
MGMHIYGLDLYNVDTAFSVRYELKNKGKKWRHWNLAFYETSSPQEMGYLALWEVITGNTVYPLLQWNYALEIRKLVIKTAIQTQ